MKQQADDLANNAERFRCGPLVRFRQGTCGELAHFPLAGASRRLDNATIRVLVAWNSFLSLESAAVELAHFSSGLSQDNALAALSELAEAGGLISETQILRQIATAAQQPSREGAITWLAIPTRDRAACIKRAAVSYHENFQHFGRKCTILVSDDSRETNAASETETVLRRIARTMSADIVYSGHDEKSQFVRQIAANGDIPEEIVQFALWGNSESAPSPGASRNAILLQTAGSLLLSVDDDTICKTGRVPGSCRGAAGLSMSGHGCPAEVWPFADHAGAVSFLEYEALDVLGEHGRFLGISMPAIAAQAQVEGSSVDLDRACMHVLANLLLGGGRVRATFNGSAGDSGFHSGLGLISSASKETRLRAQGLNGLYERVLGSRQVVRQTLAANVLHTNGGSTGMFFGLDNRLITPPFMPMFHNEDGVFACLLGACSSDDYVCNLPFSMVHQPPGVRVYPKDKVGRRVSDVLMAGISAWRPLPGESACMERLTSIGRHLARMGAMPPGEFREFLTMLMCSQLSGIIESFENCLAEDGTRGEAWVQDMNQQTEKMRMMMESADRLVPVDIVPYAGRDAVGEVQSFLASYGTLLTWWPAILERTVELRNAGGVPSVKRLDS